MTARPLLLGAFDPLENDSLVESTTVLTFLSTLFVELGARGTIERQNSVDHFKNVGQFRQVAALVELRGFLEEFVAESAFVFRVVGDVCHGVLAAGVDDLGYSIANEFVVRG